MINIKFNGMEISCNLKAANYIANIALFLSSKSGSGCMRQEYESFADAVIDAIVAAKVSINIRDYSEFEMAILSYAAFLAYKGLDNEGILSAVTSATYERWSGVCTIDDEQFSVLLQAARDASMSNPFEKECPAYATAIYRFYEKYKAAR